MFAEPETFNDSTLLSVSDYIVCTRKHLRRVLDIVKFKFKNAKLICLLRESDKPNEELSRQILMENYSPDKIVERIAADKKKFGCRTEKIRVIHIFKRRGFYSADKEEHYLHLIKVIKGNYPDI